MQSQNLNSFYPSHYHGFNTQSSFVIKNLYKLVNYIKIKKYLSFLKNPDISLLDVGFAVANYFDTLVKISSHVSWCALSQTRFPFLQTY